MTLAYPALRRLGRGHLSRFLSHRRLSCFGSWHLGSLNFCTADAPECLAPTSMLKEDAVECPPEGAHITCTVRYVYLCTVFNAFLPTGVA